MRLKLIGRAQTDIMEIKVIEENMLHVFKVVDNKKLKVIQQMVEKDKEAIMGITVMIFKLKPSVTTTLF